MASEFEQMVGRLSEIRAECTELISQLRGGLGLIELHRNHATHGTYIADGGPFDRCRQAAKAALSSDGVALLSREGIAAWRAKFDALRA